MSKELKWQDARVLAKHLSEIPATKRIPLAHPGEILEQDFLIPGGLTKYRLAVETGLTATHIGQLVRGERSITASTALRLAAYLGTSPQFWLHLQADYDLMSVAGDLSNELEKITPVNWSDLEGEANGRNDGLAVGMVGVAA